MDTTTVTDSQFRAGHHKRTNASIVRMVGDMMRDASTKVYVKKAVPRPAPATQHKPWRGKRDDAKVLRALCNKVGAPPDPKVVQRLVKAAAALSPESCTRVLRDFWTAGPPVSTPFVDVTRQLMANDEVFLDHVRDVVVAEFVGSEPWVLAKPSGELGSDYDAMCQYFKDKRGRVNMVAMLMRLGFAAEMKAVCRGAMRALGPGEVAEGGVCRICHNTALLLVRECLHAGGTALPHGDVSYVRTGLCQLLVRERRVADRRFSTQDRFLMEDIVAETARSPEKRGSACRARSRT